MSDEIDRQAMIDEEHLKLLSIGYMVSGGFAALFACFGLFYILIGIVMALSLSHLPENPTQPNQLPPAFVGWIFGGIGLALFLVMSAIAIVKFLVARNIKRRKSRTFCLVVAGLSCLEFPYGTFLGVVTFIVLGRDSVVRMFSPNNKMAEISKQ